MPYQSDTQRRYFHAQEGKEVPEDVVEEFDEATPEDADLPERKGKKSMSKSNDEAIDLLKGISAHALSHIANRQRKQAQFELTHLADDTIEKSIRNLSHASSADLRPHEPLSVPVRRVEPPLEKSQTMPDAMKTCKGCGYTMKSTSEECPRCAPARKSQEAKDIWSR